MTQHVSARCCWCQSPLVESIALRSKACWTCPTKACWRRQLATTVAVQLPDGRRTVLFVPVPKQVMFWECPSPNILWGGAAGPGKSTGVRWWLYDKCLRIPHFESLLLRENFPQLRQTHIRRIKEEVHLFGRGPEAKAKWNETESTLRFENGSLIQCGHMSDAGAVQNYLSTEYDAIVADEGSRYPLGEDGSIPLLELSTRARSNKPGVLAEGGAKFVVASNPGGPSSGALLDFFVDHEPDFEACPALEAIYNPDDWAYIPASLDDNPYIDPNYLRTLAVLPKWRYEQLRFGNWRVFSGQFFGEWMERQDGEPWHVRELAA